MPGPLTVVSFSEVGLDEFRRRWPWFFGLGLLLFVLGLIAIGAAATVTLVTMLFFGCLIIVGGLFQIASAIVFRRWGGYVVDLIVGILSLVVGILIVTHPEGTAAALTLLIAMFLIFGGTFRIAVALTNRLHHWGWLLLHGLINLALGLMIWRQWPVSGLWIIGLFMGIDLVFNGWTLMMLGLVARKLPSE
ncbi:MAG: HdeD family acid-resistance protein [Pirellulales bacterium]